MDELSEEDKLTVERARKIQVLSPFCLCLILLLMSHPPAFHVAAIPGCTGLHRL